MDVGPTKIICTIGPASATEETIIKMADEGMAIARVNFSHGSLKEHKAVFDLLNKIRETPKYSALGIAVDTKGPEIRTGIVNNPIELVGGETVTLTTDRKYENDSTETALFIDHPGIFTDLKEKTRNIYIDDGKIDLEIVSISEEKQEIVTQARTPGRISSKKGVNIPNAELSLPSISEKDRADILFGVENGADYIFASFIRTGENIKEIRNCLKGTGIKIIAKIESQQGINNIKEITEEADGIMVARGDLGIEVDYTKLFPIQCRISQECKRQGKPFIVATQVLESMTKSLRPTRAEITDLSYAVLSGAGCAMLSGETASGDFPVEVVRTMHRIIVEVSKSMTPQERAVYSGQIFVEKECKIEIFVSEDVKSLRRMQIVFGVYPVHQSVYNRENIKEPEGYILTEKYDK